MPRTETMLHGPERSGQAAAPSLLEVVLLALCSSGVLAATIEALPGAGGYWDLAASVGDNFDYLRIVDAIRRSDLASVGAVKHLWGAPYLAAAVAWITGLSDLSAWVATSFAASIATLVLVVRLWGGWVGAIYAIVSWDWLEAATLGGSEPPFLALALGALAAARREAWIAAAICAAWATTVRPVGIFAVASIVVVLIARGDLRRAVGASLAAAVVLGLYALSLTSVHGGVLAHWHGYESDWNGGWPIGVPFAALVAGMLEAPTFFAFARPAVWVTVAVLGSAAMWGCARPGARRHPVENVFVVMFGVFVITYGAVPHAWTEFPRFTLPLLPFVLVALEPWLPKDRRLLWSLAPVSGALAAGWILGFHRAWGLLRAIAQAA